jgi:uncharacterized protein YukE
MEIIGNVWNFIVSSPGAVVSAIGTVALIGGIYMLMKKAVTESVDAVKRIKAFIDKYKALFTTGEGAKDFHDLVVEVDEAVELYAQVLDKLRLTKQAQKLRDLIKI